MSITTHKFQPMVHVGLPFTSVRALLGLLTSYARGLFGINVALYIPEVSCLAVLVPQCCYLQVGLIYIPTWFQFSLSKVENGHSSIFGGNIHKTAGLVA